MTSIIIPVYNTGAYLPATIASLQALDGREAYEFICVDDGSTDNSLALLRQWADSDPRVKLYTQANAGQSVARNVALEHASGQWLYFLDSDDILDADAITSARDEAQRLGADMLMFSGRVIDDEGQPIATDRYLRTDRLEAGRLIQGEAVMATLLRTFSFRAVPWLYLVRADFFRQTGISFYPGIIHEDELFTATLTLACRRIAVLHKSLVAHRVRTGSTMGFNFTLRNMDCYLTVIDGMQAWQRQHPEQRRPVWDYCRYTLTHVLITARCLPWRDRRRTLARIIRSGYLPYVEPRRLIQFLVGRRDKSSSYINSLLKGR